MVLKGKSNTTPEMLPIIFPELQNKSVISIFRGPSHSAALLRETPDVGRVF